MDEKLTAAESFEPEPTKEADPASASTTSTAKGKLKVATEYIKTKWAALVAVFAAIPVAYLAIGAVAVALIVGLAVSLSSPSHREAKVAFLGTRILAVNDLPRMMEALSNGDWAQHSLIHSRGSLITIPETGNGMYGLWEKDAAYLEDDGVYDYGACTTEELFTGQDELLVYQNANGMYYDDGRNPCFQDEKYYTYIKQNPGNESDYDYDYVVLADFAKRMAFNVTVAPALEVLANYYSPYINQAGAAPIVMSPYAFWSDQSNMTGLEDVAEFTSMIWEGSRAYASALDTQKKAKIAPVSLAFLTVYEEDLDMWTRLFDSYGVHASIYGSYLIGCVLYATATNHMPPKESMEDVEGLFTSCRSTSGAAAWGYPTPEEAEYLWGVARRVVLKKYKPNTLEV